MKTAPGKKRQWGLAWQLGMLIILGTTVIFAAVAAYNYVNVVDLVFEASTDYARSLTHETLGRMETVLAAVEKTPRFLAQMMTEQPPKNETDLLALGRNAVIANPEIYGSMFAFEPRGFDSHKEYFGPYHYRKGDDVALEWLGSKEYEYFNLDWYVLPRELNRPVWTEPYADVGGSDRLLSTFSAPFYRMRRGETQFWGVVTADIELAGLQKLVESVKVLKSGYAYLISQNGVFVTHPDQARIMCASIFDQAESVGDPNLRRIGRDMIRGGEGFEPYHSAFLDQAAWMYYAPLRSTRWSLAVVFPEDELFAELRSLTRRTILMDVAGIAALCALAFIVVRKMVRPVERMAGLADRIAAGDLRKEALRLEDFERESARLTTREYSRLAGSFVAMVRALEALIVRVRQSSGQIGATAAGIATSARQLEATATEQAASTREVNATSRGISDRTGELVESVNDVSKSVARTADLADRGRSGLERMETSMNDLVASTASISARLTAIDEKAAGIGTIVQTINKVADQTNLLSLNAGIEAEKAGEYGLGFSVVAREIRRLADQTAQATRDIRLMVSTMSSTVTSGVADMNRFVEQVRAGGGEVRAVQEQLVGILEQVRSLPSQFEAMGRDVQAQNRAAGQISEAMAQLAASADQIKQALEEFNRVTGQLNAESNGLAGEVRRFKMDE